METTYVDPETGAPLQPNADYAREEREQPHSHVSERPRLQEAAPGSDAIELLERLDQIKPRAVQAIRDKIAEHESAITKLHGHLATLGEAPKTRKPRGPNKPKTNG